MISVGESVAQPRSLRVGILGAGFIADFHIRALKSVAGVELAAVCDVDLPRARELGGRWGVPNIFECVEDLTASGIDVVHVLVPPAFHARSAIACLRGGCHVLVEKPMATTSEECRQMEAAAACYGRKLAVNHNLTFDPAFLRLVSAVRNRRLGALEHVTTCHNLPLRQLSAGQHDHWMFRSPGNIILELGPHPLSQIQYLLGSIKRVQAMATGEVMLRTGSRFYSTWQVSCECERGTAQSFFTFGRDHTEIWLNAVGQDGAASLDLRRNVVLLSGKTRFLDPLDKAHHALSQAGSQVAQGVRNLSGYAASFLKIRPSSDSFLLGFTGAIGAFYASLQGNHPLPASMAQGRSVIEACESIISQSGVLQANQDQQGREVLHASAQ